MSEPLDPEIAAALERAGLRFRGFHRISKMRFTHTMRSAYRIDIEAGRTIKARRMDDEENARRLVALRRDLPDAFVPAFARYGAVLLEDWIDGDPLEEPPTEAHLVDAALLLTHLHTTPTVAGAALHAKQSTAAWRDTAESGLQEIRAASALAEPDARLVGAALQQLDPGQAIFGLVHTDFCGENMVVDRAGRLRVVDNERIGVDALGFDVARTWYRWALPSPAWERFRSVYAARVPFDEPLDTLGFWRIVAVVHSAALRLQIDRARAHVPLDRLRRIAVELGDSRTPWQERR